MPKRFEDAVLATPGLWARDVAWAMAHNDAVNGGAGPVEAGILNMLHGWHWYAAQHELRYTTKIGADYVLGPAWFQIGSALLRMLDGDLGRLDGGTLDHFIRQTMLDNGFEQGMADDA